MLLAVLSYPKNYHITQITIQHALKNIDGISEIAIIWDDSHPYAPSIPLSTVVKARIPCYTYFWSSISDKVDLRGVHGWAGQQIMKLHMDLLTPKEDFIIMDGDLIINQPIDPVNILYSNNIPQTHGRYDHIAEALGLGVYDFATCPFMYFKARWLKHIRELCENNSHMTIDKKLVSAFNKASSVNQLNWLLEWNIMARYQLQVLKLPRRIEYFHRRAIAGPNLRRFYNDEENFVVDGPDDIDLDFYKEHNVHIDINLLRALGYKNC